MNLVDSPIQFYQLNLDVFQVAPGDSVLSLLTDFVCKCRRVVDEAHGESVIILAWARGHPVLSYHLSRLISMEADFIVLLAALGTEAQRD